MDSTQHSCQNCQQDYLIVAQEKTFYKKKGLAEPKLCPNCRRNNRLAIRNERNLFKRKCDKCQKEVISTYRPESEFRVYCQECFWEYIG